MITYLDTNIFESPAKVLVNTVNTEGVMGKGIAKTFKQLFPEMFKDYQLKCEKGELEIGKLHIFKTPNKWILNFPTKKHWRSPSKKEYIETGLRKLGNIYSIMRISSISFPLLGCGNGELDWEKTVRPMMEKYLNFLSLDVFIHIGPEEIGIPEHHDRKTMEEWLKSEPESLSFSEVWRDLVTAIKPEQEFTSYRNENFRIKFKNDPEGMIIYKNTNEVFIHHDELMTVWQELRERGIVTIGSLRGELDNEYEYVFALFSKLQYVREVKVSTKKDLKDDPDSPGLVYTPRPSQEQLELIRI